MADLSKLEEIVTALRGEHGCPWDKKQTPQTLKNYLLEEVYELVEAIEEDNPEAVKEELGDVLFILVFLAHIYKERKQFELKHAIAHGAAKMIRRHPHVFGDMHPDSIEEIHAKWQEIKSQEKPCRKSLLDGIPKNLPALMLAYKIGKKAAKVGFDWERVDDVLEKVAEETEEFKSSLKTGETEKIKEELGDILFSWVNVARLLKIQPEDALRQTIQKFKRRFQFIEAELKKQKKSLETASLKDMDALWEKAKEKRQ
ncbi:MAG: nucleoside triphosphate pyrophosphohydrolase [Candidatus Desulfofervidaceae bacterium]|nr:nucleoside triphosphate pyrophosphohydrolase [Candidatus Desulfofervidaceae bacterium]MDL1971224.1 nucleoside triphosphate pyrophosphohydrolase [Candidatus Desulfofervidaceae bacterium]